MHAAANLALLVDELVAHAAQVHHLSAILGSLNHGQQSACRTRRNSVSSGRPGTPRRRDKPSQRNLRLQMSAAALYLVTTSGCDH